MIDFFLMSKRNIEVVVPSVGGRFEIMFDPSKTVGELKSRINDRTDIPKSIQRLLIEGTELSDADTLAARLPRNVPRPTVNAFL